MLLQEKLGDKYKCKSECIELFFEQDAIIKLLEMDKIENACLENNKIKFVDVLDENKVKFINLN